MIYPGLHQVSSQIHLTQVFVQQCFCCLCDFPCVWVALLWGPVSGAARCLLCFVLWTCDVLPWWILAPFIPIFFFPRNRGNVLLIQKWEGTHNAFQWHVWCMCWFCCLNVTQRRILLCWQQNCNSEQKKFAAMLVLSIVQQRKGGEDLIAQISRFLFYLLFPLTQPSAFSNIQRCLISFKMNLDCGEYLKAI